MRSRPARLGAILATLLLAGCNDGGVTGPPPGTITTLVTVRLVSTRQVLGLSLVLPHPSDFRAGLVTNGPLFALGPCIENRQPASLALACVSSTPFAGPATAWTVAFAHPENRSSSLIGPPACTGSLADGSTVVVTCELIGVAP